MGPAILCVMRLPSPMESFDQYNFLDYDLSTQHIEQMDIGQIDVHMVATAEAPTNSEKEKRLCACWPVCFCCNCLTGFRLYFRTGQAGQPCCPWPNCHRSQYLAGDDSSACPILTGVTGRRLASNFFYDPDAVISG